jgi:hypothetical protein
LEAGRTTAPVNIQLRLPTKPAEKGVIYTKPWVVDLILDLVGYRASADLAALVAVEPAAGAGAFLIPMVRRLLASVHAHGRTVADARDAIIAYELDRSSCRYGPASTATAVSVAC